MARFSLSVDHLNAPYRYESLSFAFRRLHHRVLISVPTPFWAHIESPQPRFVCSSAILTRVCSKPSRHAIAALGIIAPHCVEFFLNAISPPLNPNRVESEASPRPSSSGKGRYPSPLHHHQTVCFLLSFFAYSRIFINFRPDLIHMFSLLLRHFAIMCGTVEARGAQTFVDLGFGIAAHSHGFPEESSCVACFEGVHELFAAW